MSVSLLLLQLPLPTLSRNSADVSGEDQREGHVQS